MFLFYNFGTLVYNFTNIQYIFVLIPLGKYLKYYFIQQFTFANQIFSHKIFLLKF